MDSVSLTVMKNQELRIRVVAAVFLTLLLAAVAVVASDRGSSVTIKGGKNGEDVVLTVSDGIAKGILEGAIGSELSCDGELDSDFGDLLRSLDRGGRGARATLADGDSVIVARRRANTIKLDIRDADDGGEIEVVMPWAVAECLLGRTAVLDQSVSKIRLKIKGADGGKFEFKID